MARDHRIVGKSGEPIPFTYEDSYYATDVGRGFMHGRRAFVARGSVLKSPLIRNSEGRSLWLEHVVCKNTGERSYWLMWYDSEGKPTMRGGATFAKPDLKKMLKQLSSVEE